MKITQDMLINFFNEQRKIEGLDKDSLLFSDGIIDSMGMVNLIAFVEDVEGIEISQADVTLENFDSISRILGFLRRKVAA